MERLARAKKLMDWPERETLRCTYAELQQRCPGYRTWLDGLAPYLP